MEKNEKLKTLKNEELKEAILEKEKIIQNLQNNNKNLGNNIDRYIND